MFQNYKNIGLKEIQNLNGISVNNSKIYSLFIPCYLLVYKEANRSNNWFYLRKSKQGLNKRKKRERNGNHRLSAIANRAFLFLLFEILNCWLVGSYEIQSSALNDYLGHQSKQFQLPMDSLWELGILTVYMTGFLCTMVSQVFVLVPPFHYTRTTSYSLSEYLKAKCNLDLRTKKGLRDDVYKW